MMRRVSFLALVLTCALPIARAQGSTPLRLLQTTPLLNVHGRIDHFAEISAEIVKSNPEVIVANTSPFVRALKETTSTIPIVGITADPIAYGLTTSLSRPDSNVTGVSVDAGLELWGKRLAILRELIPSVSRVGFLTIRASWMDHRGKSCRVRDVKSELP